MLHPGAWKAACQIAKSKGDKYAKACQASVTVIVTYSARRHAEHACTRARHTGHRERNEGVCFLCVFWCVYACVRALPECVCCACVFSECDSLVYSVCVCVCVCVCVTCLYCVYVHCLNRSASCLRTSGGQRMLGSS